MARRTIKVTVATPAGTLVDYDVEPGHTPQDLIAALITGNQLEATDSYGNAIRYELADEAGAGLLPADKPLIEAGVADGATLRVKAGTRVGHGILSS